MKKRLRSEGMRSKRSNGTWINRIRSVGVYVALLIGAGCRQAHESGEPAAVRVESNQVLVQPGSPPASSISVETAKAPAPATLLLNGRLVWDDNVTTRLF